MGEEEKMDPQVEKLLVEYLQRDKAREQKGLTLESLHKTVQNLSDNFNDKFTALEKSVADKLAAHDKRDDERFDKLTKRQNRHGARIAEMRGGVKKIEDGLKDIEEEVEETGRYELEQLRDSRKHWTRWIPMTIVGFVLMVLGSTIAVFVAKAAGK